jgi:chemosensory pili system protein ChpA (sensor histidine kinase/response regulator)
MTARPSVVTSKSKTLSDEAEGLLAEIRGSVLVHVQDGVEPAHLKVALDSARELNELVSEVGDDNVLSAAEALEAWLTMLAAETDQISHNRTRSLLDQISELEVALIAHKASGDALDVGDPIDDALDILGVFQAERSPAEAISEAEFEADSEILEIFGEEADSLLESIRLSLETLSDQPNNRSALWEIKKNAHTLKGAAGIVGLKKLSHLAHRVEDLLERLTETTADLGAEIVGLLFNAADCLELLASPKNSIATDTQIASLHRQFDDALAIVSKSQETPSPAPIQPHTDRRVSTEAPHAKRVSPRPPSNSIVRVSLDRLDDLVRNVRELGACQEAFERRFNELEHQLDETQNNTLRLQAVSKKIGSLQEEKGYQISGSTLADPRQSTYELAESATDATVISTALADVKNDLEALYTGQSSLVAEIQQRVFRLRNVEFGTISNRLHRTVGVTCDEEGKNAEIVIENGTLEVDTQVIDAVIVPLLHLLKNAVVHGIESAETRRMLGKPEIGKITVRVSNKGAHIVLSVTDDGCGIAFRPLLDKAVALDLISPAEAEQMSSDKIRELIFVPGLTTAKKLNLNAGRGVGMSIVRESVAAQGGVVSIETWPQKGTTFSIRIPRPFAEINPVGDLDDQTDEQTSGKRLTVLIVDDSPSVRLVTSKLIENAGWHAETARDGIEALEKLQTVQLPAVILSDIEMPRMGGYELVAALREDDFFRKIPVVFISSRTADRERAAAVGAAEYLRKPYDEKQLVELVGKLGEVAEPVAD